MRQTVLWWYRNILYVLGIFVIVGQSSNHHSRRHIHRPTKFGRVRGVIETFESNQFVEKYLGIPFAKPPVGQLRFEAPQPPQPWYDGVYNAHELSPACPQPTAGVQYIAYHVTGFNRTSEDCLYLNVYKPAKTDQSRRLPVLFFVHGGSYYNGMGAIMDGSALATQDIVVVSANYRLGALGFLTAGEKNAAIPGNYGMLDLIAALKWVQENIAYFHGDPSQVTVDGHSAGGCAAGLLMMSPLAQGLFKRVIIQSGSPLAHWAVSPNHTEPSIHYQVFASAFDCLSDNPAEVKLCLQKVPTEQIHDYIMHNYDKTPSLSPQYRPVVDGHFMTDTAEQLAIKGDFHVESVMTGSTKDEGIIAALPLIEAFSGDKKGRGKLLTILYCFRGDLPEVPGIVDSLLKEYTPWPYNPSDDIIVSSFSELVGDYYITAPTHRLASHLSKHNSTIYLYNFGYNSVYGNWKGRAIHGAEIFYLSGTPMTGHQHFRYNEHDVSMSRMLLHLWASFTKNGLPSLIPQKQFFIDRYTEQNPQYAQISSLNQVPHIQMDVDYKPRKLSFWNEKVPEMLHRRYFSASREHELEVRRNYMVDSANSWVLIAACLCLSVLTVLSVVAYCRTRRRLKTMLQRNGTPIANRMI